MPICRRRSARWRGNACWTSRLRACRAPRRLTAHAAGESDGAGRRREAGVIGHAARLPAVSAALVNGAVAHALDFDDVNLAMPGHPSVAILPALLALAEDAADPRAEPDRRVRRRLRTACRVGMALRPGHYSRSGSTRRRRSAAFGAAAACAHLLGLDAEAKRRALGIAGTQAAGLKSMFGTMCKPLHAGKAAYNGLLAARLAARGFTSRADVLECAQGFAARTARTSTRERRSPTPAGRLPSSATISSNTTPPAT